MSNHETEYELPAVTGVVDRQEKDQLVIRLHNGQEIAWPQQLAGKKLAPGMTVKLVLHTDSDWQKERELLAKTILNEILNNSAEKR